MELKDNTHCVAVFDRHEDAEKAIRELQRGGFDMKKLSIVGRDYHTEEHAVGFYNAGDRVKYWGKHGAFWGSIFGILFAPAFFWIPGHRPHPHRRHHRFDPDGHGRGRCGGRRRRRRNHGARGGPVQPRRAEGHRHSLRGGSQGKQVPAHRERNRGRGRASARESRLASASGRFRFTPAEATARARSRDEREARKDGFRTRTRRIDRTRWSSSERPGISRTR